MRAAPPTSRPKPATGQQPAEIEHRFVSVTTVSKVSTLAEHIRASDGLTLVFVRTKRGADRLVQKLRTHDVQSVSMHGDKTQSARERALAQFEAGKVKALVATDVAARGLDLEGVTHVINFDPPERGQRLRPPHGPHRPCRAKRDGDHLRSPRAAGRDEQGRPPPRSP